MGKFVILESDIGGILAIVLPIIGVVIVIGIVVFILLNNLVFKRNRCKKQLCSQSPVIFLFCEVQQGQASAKRYPALRRPRHHQPTSRRAGEGARAGAGTATAEACKGNPLRRQILSVITVSPSFFLAFL